MNVLNRVTLQTLRRNRTRTLVTILGVILSAAMISAITTFIASLQNYMYESAVATEGRWETKLESFSGSQAAALAEDADIKELGLVRDVGYAFLEGGQNEDKPYLFITEFSKDAMSMRPVVLTEGRLPEREGEVVASQHIAYNGGVEIALGQTLTLEVGRRFDNEGWIHWQNTPFLEEEEALDDAQTRTFTVVGICERPDFEEYTAPGYTLMGYLDPASVNPSDTLSAYLTLQDAHSVFDKGVSMVKEYNALSCSHHGELLRAMGISRNVSYNQVLYGLGSVLIVLIMVGSVALIYNAFAISVSERSRQFGMLAGVGATSRQIYRTVLFEALVVGGIGIPLGILSGVAGIGITLYFLEGALGSIMALGFSRAEASFRLVVSAPALGIAAAVGMITVLLSAWFPARRAAKSTAIDAIRQTKDLRLRPRKVRGNRLIRRLFGLPAELALKNFRRNRRRYRATILSLVISLVLFISAATFSQTLQESVGTAYQSTEADMLVLPSSLPPERPQELLQAIRTASAVDQAVLYRSFETDITLPTTAISAEALELLNVNPARSSCALNVQLVGMEDSAFAAWVGSLGLQADNYTDASQPRAIVLDRYRERVPVGNSVSYRAGNTLRHTDALAFSLDFTELEEDENGETQERTLASLVVTAGHYTDNGPLGLEENQSYSGSICLIVPLSMIEQELKEVSSYVSMAVEAENHWEAEEQIDRIITSMATPYYVNNYAAELEYIRNLLLIVNVFSYGFIVLISLISIANVFNTISTNIHLRRREFAMLQSVGMTPGGFYRMLNFECLFYGVKALFYGLPLSFLISLWIHASVQSGIRMSLGLPWFHIGLAVASIFLVVFVTMLYAMRRIRKENIVDQLRNENC